MRECLQVQVEQNTVSSRLTIPFTDACQLTGMFISEKVVVSYADRWDSGSNALVGKRRTRYPGISLTRPKGYFMVASESFLYALDSEESGGRRAPSGKGIKARVKNSIV